ncbi:YadA-like family protein, partial [Phascolarctobacterium faecium]
GINTGNGNFTGDVDIIGDITAGTGNIGGVGMEEGTITTGDTAIDGSGITTGNGNFTGNVDIIGDITAGTGNIGGVGMEEGTITTGDTTIDGDGMTVGGEEGTSIKHDEISVGDGGYIGGGDVVSGEGVSLNQTAERVGHLENRVGELEDRVDKVGAMSAAIANLRTMGYDPAAPTEVAVGIGQYRDETGAALGLFHYPNRDFMLSLSVSTAGDEVMGGIGATWKFGRKSPEKVAEIKKAQAEADARRAEEAKLAKAEEMKQAAKEAKIKAQQERHAKLAAERAAQAEAAK